MNTFDFDAFCDLNDNDRPHTAYSFRRYEELMSAIKESCYWTGICLGFIYNDSNISFRLGLNRYYRDRYEYEIITEHCEFVSQKYNPDKLKKFTIPIHMCAMFMSGIALYGDKISYTAMSGEYNKV